MTETAPLSAEEEAWYRAKPWVPKIATRVAVGRLLATLDHERRMADTEVKALRDGLDAAREPAGPQYGWHGEGSLCLGPDCNVLDADGDHPTADVHSNDWYEGYETAQRAREPAGRDAVREATVIEMENEGVVTWGDPNHRHRFLTRLADPAPGGETDGPIVTPTLRARSAIHFLRSCIASGEALNAKDEAWLDETIDVLREAPEDRAEGLDITALEATFAEMAERGWVLLPDGHGPGTILGVFLEAYSRLAARLTPDRTAE